MTGRQLLFQLHWLLGITAGLVLAVVGITGAIMSFEEEIMDALDRRASAAFVRGGPALPPPGLVAGFYRSMPPHTMLASLIVPGDPQRLPQAKYTLGAYDERALHYDYLDPASGRLAGPVAGKAFFEKVREIHRWMLLPDRGEGRFDIGPGRWVTMIAAISLILFVLSGLYLRWPRRALDWRAWLVVDFRMTARNFYRSLHTVVGTWVLAAYLFSALTGMWWSFGDLKSWYRDAFSTVLTGHAFTQGEGDGGIAVPAQLGPAWTAFAATRSSAYQSVEIEVREEGGPVRFRVLPPQAPHSRAWDVIRVDQRFGKVVTDNRYGVRNGKPMPTGEFVIANMLALHTGGLLGLPGRLLLMVTSALLPLLAITGLLLYFDRRRKKRQLRALIGKPNVGDGALLVVHASQTRRAEALAHEAASALAQGGRAADVVPISKLTGEALRAATTVLMVASTYGDGEPPDGARAFARCVLGTKPDLARLSFGVLALGDRQYAQFCSFGYHLAEWLERCGATPLFDTVAVDGADDAALAIWRGRVAALGAQFRDAPSGLESFSTWRLVERRALNPGSPGALAFHVALAPTEACDWQAGDIVAVQCPVTVPEFEEAAARASWDGRGSFVEGATGSTPQPAARLREYSIASIPQMGRVELIVRQVRKDDGSFGVGSGWLTERAAIGDDVTICLRANPAFRSTGDERPAVLIGNGTGLAGLLAHLRQGASRNAPPMWLLFGERTSAHDRFHGAELDAFVASGALARSDYAFSRDAGDRHYVQDLVLAQRERLAEWVADGAAIYVCGSLAGMAPAVDAALRTVLGEDKLDDLIAEGRYRRDVY